MTSERHDHESASERSSVDADNIRYPTNHILAILDSKQAADAAAADLTANGFLKSEVQLATGEEMGDALGASTARSGLANILIRIAERIGATNEELETKRGYEQAMRENRFVLSVPAPTDERKQQALDILRAHGAHSVAFMGKLTIERIVPPK